MAVSAHTQSQTVTEFGSPVEEFASGGPEPGCAEMQAVIACPQDIQAIGSFLKVLDQFDPSWPRSNDLTVALIAVLSSPFKGMWKAESYAQRSLMLEINEVLSGEEDNMVFPPRTLSLIIALLHHRRIGFLFLEDILKSVRKRLLDCVQTASAPGTDQIQLAEAMARHSFFVEYIWDETDAEKDAVATLVTKISAQINNGAAVSAFELFLIGAYRPLYNVDAIQKWVRNLACQNLGNLDPTLRLLVFDRLLEDETVIEAITPVTSQVSKNVQSQYEENPYPRWRHLPAFKECSGAEAYVASATGHQQSLKGTHAQRTKVLIAGAGTGLHPISVAQSMPNAAVLAIDLSRASLAYATREATVRGVKNVEFAQADILKLADADVAFDLIESVGVLHHMENPEAGLQALLTLLKPGGYLRLALYSKAARHAVNAARARLADTEYSTGLSGIRAFRRDLIRSNDPEIIPLQDFNDFFSASEFRDLVMHVQEHQFTLEQISAVLRRNGLKFLGFSSQSAKAALRKMPPKIAQKRVRDLKAWHKYEKRNPDTFICMYDFFCMKC